MYNEHLKAHCSWVSLLQNWILCVRFYWVDRRFQLLRTYNQFNVMLGTCIPPKSVEINDLLKYLLLLYTSHFFALHCSFTHSFHIIFFSSSFVKVQRSINFLNNEHFRVSFCPFEEKLLVYISYYFEARTSQFFQSRDD